MTRTPLNLRRLAFAAIAGQVLFVASWVVAGALDEGHSPAEDGVSALGGRLAENPLIVNTGLVVLGLSIACLAPGLWAVLPRRRAALVAAVLFALVGAGFALVAFLPIDCNFSSDACVDRFEAGELSWQTEAHVWVAVGLQVLLMMTPFALGRALWPRPEALLAVVAGMSGVGIAVGGFALTSFEVVGDGLVQRFGWGAVHLWVLIVAGGILQAARPQEAPPSPTPLPPRDFFGRSWSGEGAVTLAPARLWRRFALRFHARREAVWASDQIWVVEDTATFPDGTAETRRRICEFVAPDRIRVTADDLPDGAELTLDDDGYRVLPYRVLMPVGPIGFVLQARDEAHLDPDGTLVETIAFRWLGIPCGHVVFRVRPDLAP